ncbi:MAG: hypothetical protein ACKV19_17040 [Verrucomicrobiales bacterium]
MKPLLHFQPISRAVRRAGRSATALLIAGLTPTAIPAQDAYEREPIHYWTAPLTDPVTRLKKDLESGDLELDASTERSWLAGVLAALKVPESSQVLVFSKTSLQRNRISPETPRALYFNDEVYVGWVPGGAVELAAIDASVGLVFYLLERPAPAVVTATGQTAPGRPVLLRDQECLSCHAGPMTGNVPGFMIRSVYPDTQGNPILTAGTKLTGHHSPLEQRWGGWYVTGSHHPMHHMGNALARETTNGADLDLESGANANSLKRYFDVSRYPLDQSDIVALMVLEHQVNLQTMMTQAQYAVKSAIYREDALRREMPDAGPSLGDSTRRIITHEAAHLVKNMLFADEAPLTDEGVSSTSLFADDFARAAPRDQTGQSLKTLHLGSRLFKNRCSYLINSPYFDALPPRLIEEISRFMREALVGPDAYGHATHLRPEEKRRIAAILRETKPAFARSW